MTLSLNLQPTPSRVLWLVLIASACALTGFAVASQFIIGVLNDTRVFVTKEQLQAAASVFPTSATAQSLLAQAEIAEATDHEQSAARATEAAVRAVSLSPSRYDLRLLLGSARELTGDRNGAEQAFRAATDLAPNYGEVHWKLANFLVREGKFDESLPHYRIAVASQPGLMPQMLILLWRLSEGKTEALEGATPEAAKPRLELALFLLKQGRLAEASRIFSAVDRRERQTTDETSTFLQALVNAGMIEQARRLWIDTVSGEKQAQAPLIWNGGFESDPVRILAQFDWTITSNQYARVSIDRAGGHSGSRSLRIVFNGIDTTRLDGEIRQLIQVHGGSHYRLECFVKTQNLETPEGPRVVVSANQAEIAASAPLAAGSSDWHQISVDFTVPASATSVVVFVKRIPKFSYDDPTKGTIWFDDFALHEM